MRAFNFDRGPVVVGLTAGMLAGCSGLLTHHERFEIKSSSGAIDGSAELHQPSSGSPVYGCSKNGKMSFDNPILRYRVKKSHVQGSGSSSLSNGSFEQNVE